MVGNQELVKPFVRFVGNGKLQTYIGGHHVVPNVSQNNWGQTVERFEAIKAGFKPFWFELWPLRIQRGETLLAKRAPFPCRQSLLRVQSRDLLRVEQRLISSFNSISVCVGRVAIALSLKMQMILFRRFKC
jgi:hypothetical protein